MQPEKCATCEFFVMGNATAMNTQAEQHSGTCHRNPPKVQLIGQQAGVMTTRQQPQLQLLPYRAPVLSTEFCGQHPDAVKRRARDLQYNPSEHGDGNAGFNRAPTAAEAKRFIPNL